jgi:cytochrome P450
MLSEPTAASIADPAFYTNPSNLDRVFADLRRDAPVHWTVPEGYRPFWTISKHADIKEISRQPALFLNEPRAVLVSDAAAAEIRKRAGGSRHMIRSLPRIDDPDHSALRAITTQWFLPTTIHKLRSRISELAREAVDSMLAMDGTCDFSRDVANPYPLRVILSILGLGREHEPTMLKLTQELFGPQDPETRRTRDAVTYGDTVAEFDRFFAALTEERRRTPRDDLASVIANATVHGEPISQRDANGYYITIATAGHDTTSSTIAGGMLALLRHPEEWQKLRADPALLPSAVDEMLRWVTPIRHFMRTATEDYVLRGQTIRAGDDLFLAYPSANRDEEVFAEPFSFRIDRRPNPQLSFGFGAHICLGMSLAKMEIQAFFGELLPRLAHMELTGEPAWVGTNFVQGMKRMPVRFQLREDA